MRVICVAAILLASAEEVSVRVICVAAIILVSAEEVSERVICVAAVILVSAEEVSVKRICGTAVILVSAEAVSVRVICGAAVILVFAEEVSVRVICGAAVILVSAEEVYCCLGRGMYFWNAVCCTTSLSCQVILPFFLVIDTRRPRPRCVVPAIMFLVVPATLSVIWTGASGAGDAFAAVEHRFWQKKGAFLLETIYVIFKHIRTCRHSGSWASSCFFSFCFSMVFFLGGTVATPGGRLGDVAPGPRSGRHCASAAAQRSTATVLAAPMDVVFFQAGHCFFLICFVFIIS